jgi:L-threonylcarbamoyladenylate synthase
MQEDKLPKQQDRGRCAWKQNGRGDPRDRPVSGQVVILSVSSAEIQRAADLLRAGLVVAFPTETVYGLGADAENEAAVRQIFALKGRPLDHPLIVHLPDAGHLPQWTQQLPQGALRLAECFWPGPLTLVLRRSGKAGDWITGGQDTVALRVPAHPLALELLRTFGGGVAAPSANRFGRISPTRAEHVRQEFGESSPPILDGGPCQVGVESTILSLVGEVPLLLRPGGIGRSALAEVLGQPVFLPTARTDIRAPGMLAAHYAPSTPLQVLPAAELAETAQELTERGLRVAVLALSLDSAAAELFRMPEEPAEYARCLYATLRDLDQQGFDRFLVEEPPAEEGWLAVRDRLARADVKRRK